MAAAWWEDEEKRGRMGWRNVQLLSASGDGLAWVKGWKDSRTGDGESAVGHHVPRQMCPEKHRSLSMDKV